MAKSVTKKTSQSENERREKDKMGKWRRTNLRGQVRVEKGKAREKREEKKEEKGIMKNYKTLMRDKTKELLRYNSV